MTINNKLEISVQSIPAIVSAGWCGLWLRVTIFKMWSKQENEVCSYKSRREKLKKKSALRRGAHGIAKTFPKTFYTG